MVQMEWRPQAHPFRSRFFEGSGHECFSFCHAIGFALPQPTIFCGKSPAFNPFSSSGSLSQSTAQEKGSGPSELLRHVLFFSHRGLEMGVQLDHFLPFRPLPLLLPQRTSKKKHGTAGHHAKALPSVNPRVLFLPPLARPAAMSFQ